MRIMSTINDGRFKDYIFTNKTKSETAFEIGDVSTVLLLSCALNFTANIIKIVLSIRPF